MYKYLKNMVLNLFGLESLKKMLSEVEHTTCRALEQWSCPDSGELKEATARMIFDLTAIKLNSYDSTKSSENLRNNFIAFIQGLISFPLNVLGTTYHKCLQGRKMAMKMLKNMLQERREMHRKQKTNFFDRVIEELNKEGTILTEAIALNLMIPLPSTHGDGSEGSKMVRANISWLSKEGMRFCVGTNFTKVQMAVFLHSLIIERDQSNQELEHAITS
ncbi:hypothetical protein VNO77_15160 [Canavalia gladiata]|uniref:Uncharacterized protein n=1 Tax=Canavalia gladiata TaxID=3824 RepID=A0AAN9M2F4_CANGL